MFQKLKNYLWHLPKSFFASLLNGNPSSKLILIGITGTDGKTTVASLIHQALINAGIKSESITTINSPGLHTTSPDPIVLQKILTQMVKNGTTHVVIEATAHGLDQFRLFGCRFAVSVITNTSHEHLDDFPDMSAYVRAKAKLFRLSKISILNHDDPSYPVIKKLIFKKTISYSITNSSDYQAKNIHQTPDFISFKVNQTLIKTDSSYYYQIYNILAAYAVLAALKIDTQIIIDTVKIFPEIKGRREIVKNDFNIQTIVDFAHTPNALKETLSSLKKNTRGNLICLFGATGGRDPTKRPLMGQVVSQIANIAIITADDTRNELIEAINQQIISGIDQSRVKRKLFRYFNIPNRQDAFNLAIKLAKAGDTVVACGKGHETSILHGKTEYQWSEVEAFNAAFRNKTQNV